MKNSADADEQSKSEWFVYVLVSARGEVATNLVQVYRSLGGGWQIRDNQDPVDSLPETMKEQMRERTGAWEGVLQ